MRITEARDAVILSRDIFARLDRIRRKAGRGPCDWCGRTAKLYCYGTEGDGWHGRAQYARGRFCSKDCFDSFYI